MRGFRGWMLLSRGQREVRHQQAEGEEGGEEAAREAARP